mmetsp:Transcript_33134/g.31582  ORF Transcript_33134/g.31582 Transcript_33134/m.31582 type:complete len:224 (+) Transcript_33134:327-998(+)
MLDKYGNGHTLSQWHMEDENAFASVIADQSSLTVNYITPSSNDPVYSITLKNKKLAGYQQVFIGVGVLIGVFGLFSGLALLFAFAPLSYRNKIKETLRLRPVISTTQKGRNTMTSSNQAETVRQTGWKTMTTGWNTRTTGSRQYLNIASPNESETCSITINPANVDAQNTGTWSNKDNKVHGMTTNVKKIIIKKNNKKMTSKYNAVYVKGKLVEKIGRNLGAI